MKRQWGEQELAEHRSLTHDEFELVRNRTDRSRIGFSALLKFFQIEGRFPRERKEIPTLALEYLASQLEVSDEAFSGYGLGSRSAKRDRVQIRELLGFRQVTVRDANELSDWLRCEVLPTDHKLEHLREAALEWCRSNRIEPPTASRTERILGSAMRAYEMDFFVASHVKIPLPCRIAMDELLRTADREGEGAGVGASALAELRADAGRASLESVFKEIAKLELIGSLGLPDEIFVSVPPKVLQKYRVRVASEQPREVRMHPDAIRHTLLAAFCWQRRKEITDGLVDLLIQLVHRISVRAEKKVVKTLLEDLRKIHGKTSLLFRIAEASVENPDGIIKEVVYPLVGEQTLRDLVREFKSTGSAYTRHVHTTLRSSYSNHFRRMLSPLLDTLEFRSNNILHRPVIDALELLKTHRESKQRYFSVEDNVPIDGVVKSKFKEFVVEKAKNGVEKINRINYEIAVLQALRERVRCKEIWVVGADRYRNPDEDLPSDFEVNRDEYYTELKQPQGAEEFVAGLKQSMARALEQLNATVPRNPKVRIVERRKGSIILTPLEPQPEPINLSYLKGEITRRWPMTSLLDVLKESDLRVGFTDEFQSVSTREALDREEIQKRLLLSLYGLGTNTGLKRISASDLDITYKDLLYVRRKCGC